MGIFKRLFSSSSTEQHSTSARDHKQACPLCGSAGLQTNQRESKAIWKLDERRSIALDHNVTQASCAECGKLLNDDVDGDIAAAYAKLAKSVTSPPRQISPIVDDALRQARQLPVLSEVERQEDYEHVGPVWGSLGIRRVVVEELPETVARVVRGYFAEGAFDVSVRTIAPQVVQLSFMIPQVLQSPFRIEDRFRPVRIARASDSEFSFYGQVPLYRILAGR